MSERTGDNDRGRGPYEFTIDGERLEVPTARMEAQALIVLGVRHNIIALGEGENPTVYELEAGGETFRGEDIVDLTQVHDFIAVHTGGAAVA